LVLCNGPSLLTHPLSEVPPEILRIGINQSWKVCYEPAYHFLIDGSQFTRNAGYFQSLGSRFMSPGGFNCGHALGYAPQEWDFSLDLTKGVRTGWYGSSSVTYIALQTLLWMGFSKIWIVGLELSKVKFTGEPTNAWKQAETKLYHHVPERLRHRICCLLPTGADCFPTAEWPWAAPLAPGVARP
jgi:hypothetical protein